MLRRPPFIEELRLYGVIRKSHGHQGSLVIALDNPMYLDLDPTFLFIPIEGIPVPFPVLEQRGSADHLITTLDLIGTSQEAEAYRGSKVYITSQEALVDLDHESRIETYGVQALRGFKVTHPSRGLLGYISHVDESTSNILLIVSDEKEGKELMIPYVESWISEYDPEELSLEIKCPEEVLDL